MQKTRVLFVCIHNTARSQMAEAFLNHLYGEFFEAESAGLEPGTVNSLAVEAMREAGIDISRNEAKDVFDLVRKGKLFHFVITVCDEAAAERCPIFAGVTERLHWSFPDPGALVGTDAAKREAFRAVRDSIHRRLRSWVEELKSEAGEPSDARISNV